ncbi:MAG TPA: hypothetical protein VF824_10140 [Thermoanaerobaculia bacterium]|jgi:hypothetical protein
MVLNIAGPEYDFGSVVFVVLEECEHRRRGFDDDELEAQLLNVARGKLAKIKAAYDEFGGAASYWKSLETEVLETAMPQYIDHARSMNALERNAYGVWRGGDPLARFVFALIGLVIGSIIIALPFIAIFEAMFAFALAAAGFLYPEINRYTHERRHARTLNRLVADAAAYQRNAKLHYMTTTEIRESFAIGAPQGQIESGSSTKTAE